MNNLISCTCYGGNGTIGRKEHTSCSNSQCHEGGCTLEEAVYSPDLQDARSVINLSEPKIAELKYAKCLAFFIENEHIVSFPYQNGYVNGTPLSKKVEEDDKNKYENCLILRTKTTNSKLSFIEKKNLWRNLKSTIVSRNNLNLNLYCSYLLEKKGYKAVPTEYVQNVVDTAVQKTIWCLFVNSNYSEKALQFNYTEAFNFGYSYLSKWLYYLESYILINSLANIEGSWVKESV